MTGSGVARMDSGNLVDCCWFPEGFNGLSAAVWHHDEAIHQTLYMMIRHTRFRAREFPLEKGHKIHAYRSFVDESKPQKGS